MTRYHARWICPVTSAPIEHATLVEEGGRITFVGARADAPVSGRDVDLGDVILVPGLVNTHCHLELSVMRGFLDGLGFREWILRLTAARRAVLTTEMMHDASRLSIEEGLCHGITTFADTGDSGTGFDAMLEYGVRGISYREVFGPDPAQCTEAIVALEAKVVDMMARATPHVRVGISPHAPYTVSDPLFVAAADLARRLGVPVAVHIAESALETEFVVDGAGAFAEAHRARGIGVTVRARSPIALLERTGVLDSAPLLIHCVRIDERDIASIVAHDCAVAHCPASNAKLGHGIAPLADLIAAEARVGIGSDSVASNDRMSLLEEARLASLLADVRALRPNVVPAAAALALATLGGARALGLADEIGSLEQGKSADFVAFSLQAERAPVHDPVSTLIHSIAGSRASFVAVAGEVKVQDGALLCANKGVAERVQASADRLQEWRRAEDTRSER
jgi:5-methylthioadenosine/S-adenosylhomocysteine deaminase